MFVLGMMDRFVSGLRIRSRFYLGRLGVVRACRCPYLLAIVLLLLAGGVSVLSDGPVASFGDQEVVAVQAGADAPIESPHPDLDDMVPLTPASPDSFCTLNHWSGVSTLWASIVQRPGLRPPDLVPA